jgi:predicted nucleic acid-binding protein
MKYLLDMCVICELVNHNPNSQVVEWLSCQNSSELFLSVLTIGEIKKGIAKLGNGIRAKRLERWLEGIVRSFSDHILLVDREISLEWGRICGDAERIGKKRPSIDSLIAATAIVREMTVVTRNVSDMAGMGVPIFNPFDDASLQFVE